jgi:hypothetical protein
MKNLVLEARLAVLEAAVLALAASLPPERADFARRKFSAGIADIEDCGEHDQEADAATAGVVAAVLQSLADPS